MPGLPGGPSRSGLALALRTGRISYAGGMQASEINPAIDRFAAALEDRLGDRLAAVLVYGSLVKGGYEPETSDHNVALLLRDDGSHTLRDVGEAMRAARPSRRTTLLLLTTEELARARDVFPLKLLDIGRHHRLVCGTDADLQAFAVETSDRARDCEQQLRGLAIRARRLFLRGTNNLDLLIHNLTVSYKGLIPPLAGLVELLGEPFPKLDDEALARGCELLGAELDPLLELRRWKREKDYVPAESSANVVLDAVLDLLRKAAHKADALHEEHGSAALILAAQAATAAPAAKSAAPAAQSPESPESPERPAPGEAGAEGAGEAGAAGVDDAGEET